MTLKRTVPITPITELEFMRMVRQAIVRIKTVQKNEEEYIDALSVQLIKYRSPYQPGTCTCIPTRHTPPGMDMIMPWSHFTIETVFPEIDWKDKKIRWKYSGTFSNNEKSQSGVLYHDEI